MNKKDKSLKSVIIWDLPEKPPNDKLVLLWNGYNEEKGQISILNELDKKSNDLRTQYMNFIDEIGNIKIYNKKIIDHLEINPGFSLWWMTLVAEKSIEKTKAPLDCLRLLTVKKIFNEIEPDSVKLFTNNKKLAKALNVLCQGQKIRFNYTIKNIRDKNYYNKLPHQFRAILYLVKYIIEKWSIRKVINKNWLTGNDVILFFSYFVHLDEKSLKDGDFYSRQWEQLPDLLKRKGKRINWIHHFIPHSAVPNSRAGNKILANLRKSGVKNDFHNFLESFLTISCLILTVIKWIILVIRSILINISLRRIMINHKYNFLWINIFDDWKNSTCGRNAIENILYIQLMENTLSSLPKMQIGLYLCENQSWEKSFLHLWKKYGHGKIIAVPHSTIRYWDLRYFNHPNSWISKERLSQPTPDQIAINGPLAWKMLEAGNQPMDRMVEVEALRFLHLAKLEVKKLNKSKNKILILGDLDISTTKSMLNLIEAKASLFKECIMMFKPHPANHVNIKDYPKLNLSMTDTNLVKLLPYYNLAISSIYTSAALEVYEVGLPLITVLDQNNFNSSPLRGIDGVQFVATSNELEKAFTASVENKFNKKNNFFFTSSSELNRWEKLLLV